MIESKKILRHAAALKSEHGTANPFELARRLGIELLIRELGTLKGFYKDVYDTPFIFLNSRLKRGEATLVCAHELGHHILHREFAAFGFEETSVFSPASRREYEANLFAAELLLDTREVRKLVKDGLTRAQIAAELHADERLIDLKLTAMGLAAK